ncbi:MAG: alpha/beta hydrolase [Chloroflexota bacterium]
MSTRWNEDVALKGFEAATLRFADDYDGPVVATLVRRLSPTATHKAFLYIHGFVDYFFQEHLAEQCNGHGYNFYALELRKYGRSLGKAVHPNFAKDMSEYYEEITAALKIITEEDGNSAVVLNGHSTGGLLAALYANDGPLKARISAIILNSPFFDFNVAGRDRALLSVAAPLGKLFPHASLPMTVPSVYAQSLLKSRSGEWEYDTRLKPENGFPVYLGWLNAIRQAHRRVAAGLNIKAPALVMHSDKSVVGKKWTEQHRASDAVLNVEHIRKGAKRLGKNVVDVEIKDGLHDLTLSRPDVRQRVFAEMFGWLKSIESGGAD